MISCGDWHSMALTESGRVFSWGDNSEGQLGQNSDIKTINKPSIVILRNEISIKKISCGSRHNLLLTSDGDIYWFGFNGVEKQITPTKVIVNEIKFIDIASQYYISVALSTSGIYYFWGNCGEKIREPEETDSKSFNDVFCYFCGKTHRTSEKFIDFKIKVTKNGSYSEDYEEIRKLGEGRYGEVFRVKQKYYGEYAIKKIKVAIDKEKDLLRELENFLTFKEFNAKNILLLIDMWVENSVSNECLTLYFLMEFCDKTLEEFIKELQKNKYCAIIDKTLTHLGCYIACHIFADILEGVNYLHTRKPQILHMDLHSGNVLLKKSYNYAHARDEIRAKLADFGLARICEFAQMSQTITSKRSSKLSTDVSYSEKNDIFSVAEIMIELFSIDIKRYSTFELLFILKIILLLIYFREYIECENNSPILMNKYQNARNLFKEIQNVFLSNDESINCKTIIEKSNEWLLNENEFNAKQEFENFLENNTNIESYLYQVISIFNSNLENSSELKI